MFWGRLTIVFERIIHLFIIRKRDTVREESKSKMSRVGTIKTINPLQKRGCIIDDNDQEIDFEIVEGFPDFQIGQGVRFQIKLTTLGLMATNLLFL